MDQSNNPKYPFVITLNPRKSNLSKSNLKLGENGSIITTCDLGWVEVLGPNPPSLTHCPTLLAVVTVHKETKVSCREWMLEEKPKDSSRSTSGARERELDG